MTSTSTGSRIGTTTATAGGGTNTRRSTSRSTIQPVSSTGTGTGTASGTRRNTLEKGKLDVSSVSALASQLHDHTKQNANHAANNSNNTTGTNSSLPTSTAAVVTEQNTVLNSIIHDIATLPPLHQAAYNNDLSTIIRLFQEQAGEFRMEYANQCDTNGCIALFYALSPDHVNNNVTQTLIDYGSNVNHQNNRRNTCLHICCYYGTLYKKTIKLLLCEYNANKMIENWEYQLCHQITGSGNHIHTNTQTHTHHINNTNVMSSVSTSNTTDKTTKESIAGLGGGMTTQAMLAYINQCSELYAEAINNKVILPHSIEQRCYYRSLYDILDTDHKGYITREFITSLLTLPSYVDASTVDRKLTSELEFQWFKYIDYDHNGVLTFNEFLRAILQWYDDVEKSRKAAKRKALAKAAKLKKKQEELARWGRLGR
jgi:Ca2+-binding EF-hand superfamily protein